MAGDAIESIVAQEADETSNEGGRTATDNAIDDNTELRIQVAISLCLLVGIIQVSLNIQKFNFISEFRIVTNQ